MRHLQQNLLMTLFPQISFFSTKRRPVHVAIKLDKYIIQTLAQWETHSCWLRNGHRFRFPSRDEIARTW